MTVSVSVPQTVHNDAVLRLLPSLSPAASKALDVTPAEIIARWLASITEDGRRAYARSLATFTAWAIPGAADPQAGLELLCQAGAGGAHELLVAWRDELLERLAPNTVGGRLSAIASLLRCCRRAGLIAFTIEGIGPKRELVQDRRGPKRADVERLLGHVDELALGDDLRAVRDAAIIRLLYCCALRRSEVCNLRLADVDLEAGTVSPRRKGYKRRKPVLVSERTKAAIAAWLAARGDEPGALFHRLDRREHRDHLTGESIRYMVKTRAKAAGVKAPCRPHGMRHAAASELARRGSLDELMSLGEWRSLSAASAYLDRHDENRRRALALVDA
ncbi:MAG: tyrosine-type recombinase/integrase [Planctomycetes bacterium]|nr:tyrosine-type recombinase/integrase [Planctomycetota bacterium]